MKPIQNPFHCLTPALGKSLATALLTSGAMLLSVSPLCAANFFWDADTVTALNQNGDGTWNTVNTNWTGTPGGANTSWLNGAGNTAFLGNASGTGYTNPTVGGTITLGETISLFSVSMSSGQSGSYTINGAAGLTLNLSGAGAQVGNNNTSANLTINAVVSGTVGLKKINNGRVILTGANTYSGQTNVTAGTLQFANQVSLYNNNTALWTAPNIVVNSGTTLGLNVGGPGEFTSSDLAILSGLGTNGVLPLDPADDDGLKSGAILLLDTTNATGGIFSHSTTIANPNSGANVLNLTKTGPGTLTLSGTNTYTGVTLLQGGSLGLGSSSPIGTNQLTINNAVSIFADGAAQIIPNNVFLSSTGSSVLTVSGSNNLTLSGSVYGSGSRTLTTTIASPSKLTINGNVYFAENDTVSRTFTFGSAVAAGSTGTVLVNGSLNNNSGANTLASNLVVSGGGTVILAGGGNYGGTTTVSNSNTILQIGNGGTTGALGSGAVTVTTGILAFNRTNTYTVANTIGGTGILRQNGSGTTILAGPNTYSGLTSINAGILEIAHATALGTTTSASSGNTTIASAAGALALSGGITVAEFITISGRNTGDLLINTSGNNSLTGTIAWSTGGTAYGVRSDLDKLTVNGSVNPAGGSKTLLVHGAGDLEFTGVITDTATGLLSVTKDGAGTVTLSNTNTYTGATTINAGTLVLTSSSLANTAALNINATAGGVLNLPNAGTDVVGSLVINGSTKPDGLYDSTNSSGAISGAGKIQVGAGVPANPFQTWITTNYPTIPVDERDPEDDFDHDGSLNLIEFALDGDPTSASDNGLMATLIQDASAPAGNELTLIVAVRDGAVFASGVDGVQTASVDGITYTVQGSLDLGFPASAVSTTGSSDTAPAATGLPSLVGTDWEYHTFKLDASENLPGKGFLRLKVTQP